MENHIMKANSLITINMVKEKWCMLQEMSTREIGKTI